MPFVTLSRSFALIAALALAACGGGSGDYSEEENSSYRLTGEYTDDEEAGAEAIEEDREPFDEDAAREEAERQVESDSYAGIGAPWTCTGFAPVTDLIMPPLLRTPAG